MKPIRFGIIGAGHIAHTFCNAVQLVDDAEVIAVASKTPGKSQTFAEANNLPHWYDNYEAMLSLEDIDVVYIATTHNFHFENAMLCIAHHKAILCEKCFVLTEQEARTVFAAAKQEGLFVMEAMWSRFLPAIQKAKSWIQEGAIGDLELAHNIIGFKADEDPKGRILNPHLAGGAMYDIGVYAIELMTYLVDQEIQEIQSMVTRAHTDVDKVDNISIRFESCIANLQAAISIYCGTELKIYGTKGYIVIPNAHYASECMLYNQYEQVEHFVAPTTNGFRYQVQEVVDCLRNGQLESSIMPHDATIQCAAIFDQCLGTK